MKRSMVLSTFLLILAALPVGAEGAGGVEFFQVVGQDLWKAPGGAGLPAATGQISSVGGYGYGVDNDGTLVGGFGMGVTSKNLHLEDSLVGSSVDGFAAGYGGVINGWQHRWGPLVGTFTTRVGFGGADWRTAGQHRGGFSLLGMAEGQMGLLVLPWFSLGVTAGVAGTLTFVAGDPFLVGYAPTVGVRLAWGSF